MMVRKYAAIWLATAALALSACGNSAAKDESESGAPTGPVEFLVAASAGGGSDLTARKIADLLNKEGIVEEPITVVNKTGAGGNEAWLDLQKSKGSPNKLAMIATSYLTTPLQRPAGFSYKDFTNHALLATDPWIIMASGKSDLKTLDDLADPNTGLKFGGTHVGAMDSFAVLDLEEKLPTKFNYVPYDGVADVMNALLGGDIEVGGGPYSAAIGLLDAGRLKVLGVLAEERLEALPDVPSAAELGYAINLDQFRGVVGPGGLTDAQAEYWQNAFKKLSESEAWKDYVVKSKLTPLVLIGDEAESRLDEINDVYRDKLDALGLLGKN